jgi:CHASE2 domain-containing sensor protein
VTTVGRRRVPRFTQRDALVAGIAGVVAALVLVLYFVSALGDLERATIDTRFSVRGAKSPGTDIVVIAIDQKTLTALNVQPPIPRADYAQVLDRIHAAAPRLIAIDTQFVGRSHPADDRALLGAIARDGPIILATHEGDQGPIPVPAGVGGARGAIPANAAIDTDPDGVLWRMLFAPVELPTLAKRRVCYLDRFRHRNRLSQSRSRGLRRHSSFGHGRDQGHRRGSAGGDRGLLPSISSPRRNPSAV